MREQEGKSLELGRLAMEYETLARVVKTDTALYESVLTRLNETDVTKNILTGNAPPGHSFDDSAGAGQAAR